MANALSVHLGRIVDSERERGVRRLTTVRLLASLAGLAVALGFGLLDGQKGWLDAAVPIGGYVVVSFVLVVLVRAFPSLSSGLGLAVALLDVPAVTLIQYQGMNGALERFIFGGALGLFCSLIVLSALMLSRAVVAATCVAVLIGQAALYRVASAPLSEHAAIVIAPVGTAAVCAFLIGRIRGLVEEARRDDLMGKYLLGERIGAGGMAEVFRATYCPEGGFERQVAVKRVLPAYASDMHFIDRFRREAELTAQLVHPNIVQVLDFGYHRDTWFLAMELVEGVPLSRLLDAPLPIEVAIWVAQQLSDALDYVHGRGLMHRDLNPPNVLVSKHGEVKLADFGVARAAAGSPQLTQTGFLVGKRAYLAPEQIRGEPYDSRADLFALGLTLYELFAGRRAVLATSEMEMMKGLLEAQFVPPSKVRAEVPVPLDEVVLGLLESDPKRRTQSAGEVRAALTPFAKPEGKALLAALVSQAHVAPVPAPRPSAGGLAHTVTSARAPVQIDQNS